MLKLVCAFLEISYVISSQSCLILISSVNSEIDFCAGSLISKEWIATTAQCVYGKSAKSLGVYNNEKSQYRLILNIFVHKDYDPYKKVNDVALLRVKEPFIITEDTRPSCIHNQKENILCNTNGCEKKDKAKVPKHFYLVRNEECRKSFENTVYASRITNNVNCYYGPKTPFKSIDCKALPGFPLTFQNDFGESVLTGILNIGWTCSFYKFPFVFTKISSYYNWVKDITLVNDGIRDITCFQDRKFLTNRSENPKYYAGKEVILLSPGREKRRPANSEISDKIQQSSSMRKILYRLFGAPGGNLDTSLGKYLLINLSPKDTIKERLPRQDEFITASSYEGLSGPVIAPPLPGGSEDKMSVVIEEPGARKGSGYLMVQFPAVDKYHPDKEALANLESDHELAMIQEQQESPIKSEPDHESAMFQDSEELKPQQGPVSGNQSSYQGDIKCIGNICFPGKKPTGVEGENGITEANGSEGERGEIGSNGETGASGVEGVKQSDGGSGTDGGIGGVQGIGGIEGSQGIGVTERIGENGENGANGATSEIIGNGGNGRDEIIPAVVPNGEIDGIGRVESNGKRGVVSHFLFSFDGDILERRPAHEIILKANKFLNLDFVRFFELAINYKKVLREN